MTTLKINKYLKFKMQIPKLFSLSCLVFLLNIEKFNLIYFNNSIFIQSFLQINFWF